MLVQASTLITEFHRLQEDLESIFLKLGYNKQLENSTNSHLKTFSYETKLA
jgi:hypothetical protein